MKNYALSILRLDMSVRGSPVCKITVSLPIELVQFAEREAVRLGLNRSQVISQALKFKTCLRY